MDEETAKIEVTVPRRFLDHLRLQFWWKWQDIPILVLIYLTAVMLEIPFDLRNGISVAGIERDLARSWPILILLAIALVALALVVKLAGHTAYWVLGWTPHTWTFAFEAPGIVVILGGQAILIYWSDVGFYTETDAVLFIATKQMGFHLPKSNIEGDSLDAVRALLAAQNVRRAPN